MNPGPAPPGPTPPHGAEEPLRILLIEDNPGDARLIEMMLTETSPTWFEVERVERLGTGLQRLAEKRFGLVLLDLSLPDSSGFETFHRLRVAQPDLPLIVLSGLNDERVALTAVQQGAQDYLVKGHVDALLLTRAIRYALERKRIQDQLEQLAAQLQEKNAQMQADLEMAREIQQIFLPHQYPSFPRAAAAQQSALQFHHRYLPAAAVSGDFFSVLPISDTMAGVFLCDVMGHGLRAALVTAIMRGLVEELMPLADRPGPFLTEINRSLIAILRRTDEPLLTTALYLVFDLAGGELRFARAGHASPIRIQGSSVQLLQQQDGRHGPALGLFEDPNYPECHAPLAPQDLYILFTDGLYEVHGPHLEDYGLERLLKTFRHHAELKPPNLLEVIVKDVQTYAGSKEFDDDVCLISVEVQHLLKAAATERA